MPVGPEDFDRQWLAAFGVATSDAVRVPYTPLRTLKQVLDDALALGARSGKVREAIEVVGTMERRMARLARSLRLDRQAGTVAGRPPTDIAIITAFEGPYLILGGRWIPGLAAAAGAHAVGADEGGPDVTVSASDLESLRPGVLLVASSHDPTQKARAALAGFGTVSTWLLDGQRFVNRPGPNLARSAELIAFAVHGSLSGVTPAADEMHAWNADAPE